MKWSPLLLALLVACGGEEKPKEVKPTIPQPKPEEIKPPDKIAIEELEKTAANVALVPSPIEMQKALERAQIQQALATLVTDRKLKMDVSNKDVIAVRTGVLLADVLLTLKDAPKGTLVDQLTQVKTGLEALGAGNDIRVTMDELINKIQNDTSRPDLIKDLDELQGAVIPEIKFEIGERCVPLIQAGSWLEGTNLVARATIAASKPEAATALLRQPHVVDYFQKYVQLEGPGKAPSDVIKQLEAALTTLGGIARKPSLTLEDVQTVQNTTDSVLSLL